MRDTRHGFSIPPQLTAKTIPDAIPRPRWWIDFLTTPPLEFASLSSTGGTVGELLDSAMDPPVNFRDLEIIREMWRGKIAVKGVQNVEDSVTLVELGVDAVVQSNHGGRRPDRAPAPFQLLPSQRDAVGDDMELIVDTGIMNCVDILAAMALGADVMLIGRAYL